MHEYKNMQKHGKIILMDIGYIGDLDMIFREIDVDLQDGFLAQYLFGLKNK